ncbi:MAG: sugar kinase [candidate division Zixibacteria bacterium]|nr:sugar kinase [candidate division Zixibacteria bacterium]
MDVLIVGSVALDTIDSPHGHVDRALGGSATYGAVAASHFATPGIVAVVGADFDAKHTRLLKNRGVDLTGLQIDTSGKTFHWSGYYEGDMNQAFTRSTDLNVFASFTPVIPTAYRHARVVVLGNIQPSLQLEVLRQVAQPKVVICDTMNFWINSRPEQLREVFRKVDVICINDAEACQFCGTHSLPAAAQNLLKLGPSRVIVKRGSHGVSMFSRDSFFALPAIPLLKFRDPTGAGDSFLGGLAGYLARSRVLNDNAYRRALAAGTVLASYCVEDFSCRRLIRITVADINARAALLREATRMPGLSIR